MKSNPIEITNYIQNEYSSFLSSIFTVDDPDYQGQLQQALRELDLFHGPYVKTVLPFVKGDSIRQLIDQRILSPEFLKLKSIDPDRPLYSHQVEAINKAAAGRNLIITTGTGSGKTESFLLPILNHILKEKKSSSEPTVKALFLYPMNALVNDQLDRIREILKDYPSITFGRYIGDTKETVVRSKDDPQTKDRPANELLSREEIRKTPPDILITNYSMLEYLMIRPDDSTIINPDAMKDWQFLVLDEAHTYTGTKGTEISYLLRRLKGFTQREPQCILTSATLGDESSVKDIVRFGENLTFSSFEGSDVVFAHRIGLQRHNILFRTAPGNYPVILENLQNPEILETMLERAPEYSPEKSPEENLYYFLLHDEQIYRLYDLAKETTSFTEILKKLPDFSESELISLIRLLCLAKTEQGDFLFDAKYHFFISSPSRAFITLGKNKEIRFGNHAFINGKKAFEIGRCRQCSHLYIVGREVNGFLEPEDSIESYESYEDSDYSDLRTFSLTDEQDDEEELEGSSLTEYHLCSVCGAISSADDVPHCEHGASQMVSVYEIPKSLGTAKQSFTRCPHCGGRSRSGVVRSFHLDQSTATSVLGNIFINALGEQESHSYLYESDPNEFDLFSENWSDVPDEDLSDEKDTKQILAFSDGRQQASYFAVTMERIHDKAVKEHMILNELDEHGSLPLHSLASKMENIISREDLFENRPQAEAWIGILQDLLYLDGPNSSEKIGLYAFQYPISQKGEHLLTNQKNQASIKQKFGLSVNEFVTLINFAVDHLRRRQVVNYSMAELSDDERNLLSDYPIPPRYAKGYIEKTDGSSRKKEKDKTEYISFSPLYPRGNNRITNYLRKICNINNQETLHALAKLLFVLMNRLGYFEKSSDENHLQLQLDRFEAVNTSSVRWYQCSRCKKITAHNIRNICPEPDCTGTLHECDPAALLKDGFYYKQYTTIPIERIRVKEHTAQLNSEQAKQYQDSFKSKRINLLSCSTTFEVGVDIGSLENVMMRNMPPSPANYVQRAGRAGRGKDSSALVLTYCLNKSHDYAYFMEPHVMIDGVITPPVFTTENRKIVIRHVLATALGHFLRRHPARYRDKDFVFSDGMQDFIQYLSSHPSDLGKFLDTYILAHSSMADLQNFGWVDHLVSPDSYLNLFITHTQEQMRAYKAAIAEAVREPNPDYKEAARLEGNLKRIRDQNLVSLLSSEAVIPKYGFPVDVVELNRNNQQSGDYNLSRDLRIAISEYAPGSEVVVDKKKITSRYINLPKATKLEMKYYQKCENCKSTNISIGRFSSEAVCSNCGEPLIPNGPPLCYLVPSLGFTAEYKEPLVTGKPVRGSSGEIRYIGNGIQGDEQFDYHSKVKIQSLVQDELAVLNESNFYYCDRCGYTELFPPTANRISSRKFKKQSHRDSYGRECSNPTGHRVSLGHVFKTDVVILNILGSHSFDELITTGFALRLGIHKVLQIELEDIDTTVIGSSHKGFQLLLFDNVPGGAGYVRKLLNEETFTKVLLAAYDSVSHDCCDEETTCTKCLRTYRNQNYHKSMKRRYAKEILAELLEGICDVR